MKENPAAIENLVGSGFNDALTGSTVANLLDGGAGNDLLNGAAGNDILTGGLGSDAFLFNSTLGASNIDRIIDFSVIDDTIQLENNGIFTALTTTGTLAAAAFQTGAAATQADDRIIYNPTTGALLYDADGSGSGAAIQFASLTTNLALANQDFLVI